MKIIFLTLILGYQVFAQTENQTAPVPTTKTEEAQTLSWPRPSSLVFSGDFRYRYQSETQEPKETRKLQRLQVRLQADADVQKDLKFTLRLMTGSAANSGNQTLGDEKAPGMVRRGFGLDQAYFDYKPFDIWNIYGGKMPQPLTFVGKNQLILDRDITLEGLATKMKTPITDELQFFMQGGFFMIRENYDSTYSEDMTDNTLNVIQTGFIYHNEEWTATAGYGSFGFTGLKDNPPASLTAGASNNGNTLDLSGNYPANFDLEEYFLEIKKKWSEFELSAFYESVQNKDIENLNKANSYGFILNYKNLTASWAQQEVQKDAVVGLFSDSDFGGGQTSSRGQIYSLNYKLSKKTQLQYTVYKNTNSIDTAPAKYDRTHLDLMINF